VGELTFENHLTDTLCHLLCWQARHLVQEKVVKLLEEICGADANEWNAKKPTIDAIMV